MHYATALQLHSQANNMIKRCRERAESHELFSRCNTNEQGVACRKGRSGKGHSHKSDEHIYQMSAAA